jgi:hypothetical protein
LISLIASINLQAYSYAAAYNEDTTNDVIIDILIIFFIFILC